MKKITLLLFSFITISLLGCKDSPSLIEGPGKDIKAIQSEFKKGYDSDTLIQVSSDKEWAKLESISIFVCDGDTLYQKTFKYNTIKIIIYESAIDSICITNE
jgi:hypothetical protein